MWSSKALRGLAVAIAVSGVVALSACTSFKPVYGDAGVAASVQGDFRYAAPTSELEQIIYQALFLKLGVSKASAAPLVAVTTSSSTGDLTKSDVARPNTQHQVTVSAHITITSAIGKVVFDTIRTASAVYTTDGQGLADAEALKNAERQATTELAETVRLTILASTGLKSPS
jgi:LPS-assembly lipoprotein